jgi:hypothetical protein
MSDNIKSKITEWINISNELYNGVNTKFEHFYTAYDYVQNAIELLNSNDDLGVISFDIKI